MIYSGLYPPNLKKWTYIVLDNYTSWLCSNVLTCVQISSLIFKCTHTLCANFGLDKHSLGNSMILDHVHLARCTLQWTRVTRWTKFTGVGPALYRFFPGTVTLCPGSKNPRTENLLPGTKNLFLGREKFIPGIVVIDKNVLPLLLLWLPNRGHRGRVRP